MVKILVFGDSIAWGAFDSQGGWVERLKAYYFQSYAQKYIGVYNLSVSSNDTRGVLEFLEQDIKKIMKIESEELILLFAIGSNDGRMENGKTYIELSEFKSNVKKIIKLAKKHSKRIIFTGLMKVDEKLTTPWKEDMYWTNKQIEKYSAVIEKEAEEFIPMDMITMKDLDDGMHPNTKGHEKIYKRVREYLEKKVLVLSGSKTSR